MCDDDGDRMPCSNSGWLPSCVALGKLLNLSGLRVSHQQIAGNKSEYFLDTHFTGCADQIKLCMRSNWIVPGTGKDRDSRRVFYHYYDGGAKQTGMLFIPSQYVHKYLWCDPYICDTLCYTLGTEQQTKMPFLANQSLKCTWILGVGRAVLQTQRWEWPHLFNYQVAIWLRYPSSGLGATLLQRKAQKRKKRKQRDCSRNWENYVFTQGHNRPREGRVDSLPLHSRCDFHNTLAGNSQWGKYRDAASATVRNV